MAGLFSSLDAVHHAAPGVLDPLIPVTSEQRGEGEGRPRPDIGCS